MKLTADETAALDEFGKLLGSLTESAAKVRAQCGPDRGTLVLAKGLLDDRSWTRETLAFALALACMDGAA